MITNRHCQQAVRHINESVIGPAGTPTVGNDQCPHLPVSQIYPTITVGVLVVGVSIITIVIITNTVIIPDKRHEMIRQELALRSPPANHIFPGLRRTIRQHITFQINGVGSE